MILITFVLLLFGCIDRTKLNNASHINSIEKRAQPQSWITSPQHVLGSKKNDAKAGSGFKTAANIILRKLGSPKAQSSKARKQKSKNDGQLSLFEANRHPN